MKKALTISLSILMVLIMAPILCFLTGSLVTGHDSSQVATVGEIELHGFPVWFRETAPGYSAVDGLHFDRLLINTFIWAVILGVIVWQACRRSSLRREGEKYSVG